MPKIDLHLQVVQERNVRVTGNEMLKKKVVNVFINANTFF